LSGDLSFFHKLKATRFRHVFPWGVPFPCRQASPYGLIHAMVRIPFFSFLQWALSLLRRVFFSRLVARLTLVGQGHPPDNGPVAAGPALVPLWSNLSEDLIIAILPPVTSVIDPHVFFPCRPPFPWSLFLPRENSLSLGRLFSFPMIRGLLATTGHRFCRRFFFFDRPFVLLCRSLRSGLKPSPPVVS